MSLYEFSMLRFDSEKNMFDVNKGKKTNLKILTLEDTQRIYNNYKRQMKSIVTKSKGKKIQQALNKIVNTTENDKKLFESIVERLINQIDSYAYKRISSTFINAGLENPIFIKGGTIKLDKTKIKSQRYEQIALQLAKEFDEIAISQGKKIENLATIENSFDKLNGSLNKLRGDIFEEFLAEVFNSADGQLNNFINKNVNKMIEDVKTAAYASNLNKDFKAKVSGGDTKETISIKVTGLNKEETMFSIAGSQGKADVTIKDFYPKNPLKKLGISAKNYSSSQRYLTLLSGANITNLILD